MTSQAVFTFSALSSKVEMEMLEGEGEEPSPLCSTTSGDLVGAYTAYEFRGVWSSGYKARQFRIWASWLGSLQQLDNQIPAADLLLQSKGERHRAVFSVKKF